MAENYYQEELLICGGKQLVGEIELSASKNAALPLLAAVLLTDSPLAIENLPELRDVHSMCEVLRHYGVAISPAGSTFTFAADKLLCSCPPAPLMRSFRAGSLLLGPLLARCGYAELPLPGGCAIGRRPLDLHFSALQALGAQIEVAEESIVARADGLSGAQIRLGYPSVGATENVLLAAVLARGETVLENAAREPEVVFLAECLRAMGAEIEGAGESRIRICGVERLDGGTFRLPPDRIEAGTWACAAAACGGELLLRDYAGAENAELWRILQQMGAEVRQQPRGLSIAARRRLQAAAVTTGPYPAFPTDLQAPLMAAAATAVGLSRIRETVFENRYHHAAQLQRLGAVIGVEEELAVVVGMPLKGAVLQAQDLRGAAALLIGALAAQGESRLGGLMHLRRGYEQPEQKLVRLGADIRRILPIKDENNYRNRQILML